jgi:Flp pilus assembly protein TadB
MKRPLAWVVKVLAVFLLLQFYLVRELLAAELLFGLGFAVLLVLGALAYLVGSVAERGLKFANVGVPLTGDSARRGLSAGEPVRMLGDTGTQRII